MDPYSKKVEEFHDAFGYGASASPVAYHRDRDLRMRLIKEEVDELFSALDDEDPVKVADGLADLLYVTFGTAITYGVPMLEVFKLVHNANMKKRGAGRRGDGKLLKPQGWQPPDAAIEALLREKGLQ